ncbi:MAG: YceD family protein [Actinomycetota bacterium]
MSSDLRFHVADIAGRPGERRLEQGSIDLDLRVGESRVRDRAPVEVTLEGISDGVLARFRAAAAATLQCTRCLREWEEEVSVSATQVFESVPDEDGYALGSDDAVDLAGPVRDEIALAVPARPLCREDCAGLCPRCGSDLNEDPCDGHDEPVSSPFAVLQGLFDSPDQ